MDKLHLNDRTLNYTRIAVSAAIALALATASGCNQAHQSAANAAVAAAVPQVAAILPVNLTAIKPNEDGLVPIIMYHNIRGSQLRGMNCPPSEFRKDIEWLYNHNYRPISLTQFVQGRIDCPAGTTPVILTFDDGLRTQFNELGPGQVDPNSAVGILDAFHAEHPDWQTRATFFVLTDEDPKLPPPFYQKEYAEEKMRYLVKEGFDIGNHTVHHLHMNRISDDQVVYEIAGGVEGIHKYLPDYDVQTFALPYGDFPRNKKLVITGTSDGVTYNNLCAMDAAFMPSASVISKRFNPYRIQRMTAGNGVQQSRWWLAYLERNKGLKFVSDGDPNTITVPASRVRDINKAKLAKLHLHLRAYSGTKMKVLS